MIVCGMNGASAIVPCTNKTVSFIIGNFLYNNKGTFEGEITIRGANDPRREDIDFSGLTGYEKIQYGKSGSVAKSIASARISVDAY
ncbi:MAG: hypothetical protein LBV42_04380 [Methanobrevibacter sp.]|jgi:hypothetical protein|nr:hypothetical protein [Methanobrevibacter sp.]